MNFLSSAFGTLTLVAGLPHAVAACNFPEDSIYLGFAVPPSSTLQIPVSASDLSGLDTPVGPVPWVQTRKGKRLVCTNQAAPQITLFYEVEDESGKSGDEGEQCLTGMSVIGPKTTNTLFNQDFFLGGDGPNALGTLEVSFRKGSPVVNNKLDIPSNSDDAEDLGWQEGGCIASMGGSHYFKAPKKPKDWNGAPPITPIYNTAGTKELRCVILMFGNLGTELGYANPSTTPFPANLVPNNGLGFDNYGMAISTKFGCELNYCSNELCLDYVESINDGGASPMHIMFYDPSSQDATCNYVDSPCCANSNDCPSFSIWLPEPVETEPVDVSRR